jgi:2-polyprenyl-3-methyl-5-hydroxy-6-metoxy-1,4-benzoquinol methylase
MSDSNTEQQRWKQEAEFFDAEARLEMERLAPVDPRTIERYGKLQRRRFNKEYRFRVIGSLAGKKVLDVGCGDGLNAMNLALLGGHVTGIDISPGAIEVAKRRAEINGVSDRTSFIVSPLETAAFQKGEFDIIWIDAVLHHLLADLDGAMKKITSWAKPGGTIIIGEPVNLSNAVRKLRHALPIKTDHTPDERPLEPADIAIVARHVADMHVRYFSIFTRLSRFVLGDADYESSSAPRRMIFNLLAMTDYAILSVPVLQRLAGTTVMHGRARSQPA